MKLSKLKLLASIITIVATGGGLYACSPKNDTPPATTTSAQPDAAASLFDARFNDLNGNLQPLSQWRGKIIVVNFWATWCPPCREEIPEFIKMQEKYGKQGLVFVGIAIDQKDKVQAYADEMGINYPILLGELEAIDLAKRAGNRLGGLPYTAIIDRNGKMVASEIGGLTQAKLETLIKPLL